jgi:hypothetical protein
MMLIYLNGHYRASRLRCYASLSLPNCLVVVKTVKTPIRLRVLDKGRKPKVFHGKRSYALRFRQNMKNLFLFSCVLMVLWAPVEDRLYFGALTPLMANWSSPLLTARQIGPWSPHGKLSPMTFEGCLRRLQYLKNRCVLIEVDYKPPERRVSKA